MKKQNYYIISKDGELSNSRNYSDHVTLGNTRSDKTHKGFLRKDGSVDMIVVKYPQGTQTMQRVTLK